MYESFLKLMGLAALMAGAASPGQSRPRPPWTGSARICAPSKMNLIALTKHPVLGFDTHRNSVLVCVPPKPSYQLNYN